MPYTGRGATRLTALMLSVVFVLAGGIIGAGSPATAATPAPGALANPTHNISPPPLLDSTGNCTGQEIDGVVAGCESPCYPSYRIQPGNYVIYPLADTPACTDLAIAAINAAHVAEHIRPIVLPKNYYDLNVSEQLFVLTNLERITRGIPPLVGLVHYLDDVATVGARQGSDPFVTNYIWNSGYDAWRSGPIVAANSFDTYTSVWAGGSPTPAAAMFAWMYDDGWGGSVKNTWNFDCTSAHAADCWGHRANILGDFLAPQCLTCVAGTGYASSSSPNAWATSYAMIFMDAVNSPAMSFTWNTDVLPELPAAYERVPAAA